MKNLFYLVVTVLLMGGCSYKNSPISLDSYSGNYGGELSKEKKSVFVGFVKDIRATKPEVGYLLEDNEKKEVLYSDVDFAQKYHSGVINALNRAGFQTDVSADEASIIVELYIENIEIIYNDKHLDVNLECKIEVEVVVRRGGEVINQHFKHQGWRWIATPSNSKDFEPFLYTHFEKSINDIVSKLTHY
ncbi:MAG: hypothetical protein NTW78_08025 [Campylobacterales bacterium]|nr:hypothetical protein [Campylobacterales bacterium]